MPPFVSHAQNFEDVLLWRALKDVADGFYIDVGAWEPDHDSVTRAFSERGWRGVNVEPVSVYHAMLEARRPRDVNLRVAVGAASGETVFFQIEDTGMSTTDADLAERHAAKDFTVTRTDVEVMTLAEICQLHAPGEIHFLKLDCEGSERDALIGADFSRFRPWIVLVEATVPNSQEQNHQKWEDLLLIANYRFVWFDGLNRFYVAAEHATRLGPKLALPPNVFDKFVRAREVRDPMEPVMAQLAALRRELREMRTEQRARLRMAGSLLSALNGFGDIFDTMYTMIGRAGIDAGTPVFSSDGSMPGYLAFGPYCQCWPGVYEVAFMIKITAANIATQSEVAVLDVVLDGIPLKPVKYCVYGDFTSDRFSIVPFRFTVTATVEQLETRLWVNVSTGVTVVAAVAIVRVSE